jgi:hypothetical protein
VYSYNSSKTKLYAGQVNIHQVDPDSVQYHKIADNQSFLNNTDLKAIAFDGKYYVYAKEVSEVSLYQSTDAKEWTKVTSTSIPADLVVSGILANDAGVYGYTASGEFYVSYDATKWINIKTFGENVNYEYPVKAILGFREESPMQKAGFSLIVEKENKYIFAFTSDFHEWRYATDTVPGNFPIAGFSTINYELAKAEHLSLVSGKNASGEYLNTVWELKDTLEWVLLSDNKFPKLQGANAFVYDDEFYLMNGQLENGSYNKEVYYSIDKGLNWKIKKEKYFPPSAYPLRKNALWLSNAEKTFFYVLGGQNNTNLTDIWQVFLNKKMFAE